MADSSRPTLSVIIPTLNEGLTLPTLLRALRAQTRPPDEIVVADAGSRDDTVEQARQFGALVVPGGKPGPGRNAGARAAHGDLFLFLDADVVPPPDFIAKLLAEFSTSGCGVATSLQDVLDDNLTDRLLIEAVNLGLQILQPFSPHAPGYCIIIRRELHALINGFDEACVLAEDYDYVQRAAKHAPFGVLTSVRIPVSMRRLEKDGFFQVAYKYVWCEMYALAGKPIYSVPFDYKFGEHLPPGARARKLIDFSGLREQLLRLENPFQRLTQASRDQLDLARLREQLDRFENPLARLSQTSLDQLERLARLDWLEAGRERIRLQIDAPDAAVLQRYLRRRLELVRRGESLRRGWRKLKTLPRDSLRLLDPAWLARLRPPSDNQPPD